MIEETLKQLKDKCSSLNLPTYGTKTVLKQRIENATNSNKRKVPEEDTEQPSINNTDNE